MEDEIFDEEHLKAIEDFRREVILEWRNSVQKALNGGAKKTKRTKKSQYDIRSSFSTSASSSSQLPPPDYQASLRSKLAIWPWLLRASHSCGNTLIAITKFTSLAVENCNYRDSFNGKLCPIRIIHLSLYSSLIQFSCRFFSHLAKKVQTFHSLTEPALGVDNVEYQWQTWDVSLNRRSCDPSAAF